MKSQLIVSLLSACIVVECFAQESKLGLLFPGKDTLTSPYGITSHITWSGYDYDNYKACIDEIAASGSLYIRTDFNRASINWGKENQDYAVWDNIVQCASAKGLRVAPLVYPSRYDKYSKEIDESYIPYLKDCLNRYASEINTWEIWNEMDLMYDSDGKVSFEEYVPMLKSSYNTIKKVSQDNTVLLGAIGDFGKPYFENLLQNGAADFYDVTNIHYYSARNVPEAIVPFYEKTVALLKKYNVEKPLWLTETGYSTHVDENSKAPDRFYTDVLPLVYKRLGIKTGKVQLAVLLDARVNKYLRNQDNPVIHSGFKGVKAVSLDDMAKLDVKQYPVLMILFGESFPMVYFDGLQSYVAHGGTAVFPEGGILLYYDLNLNNNELKGVGKSYYKKLHIDCMYTWDEEAKEKDVKTKMMGTKMNPLFGVKYSWLDEDLNSPKYFKKNNLEPGDEMIPIVYGYDDGFSAPVAVCYKLDSDLKGNVIIQARNNLGYKISEDLDAIRYPRLFLLSFAVGVDKVFAYSLTDRSAEEGGYGILRKDLSRKPVFYTLRTLTQKCPSGSTRPQVAVYNHQYIASWEKPDGKVVYAVWSDRLGLDNSIKVRGRARYYNDKGKRINKRKYMVTPSVVYIERAKEVKFDNYK